MYAPIIKKYVAVGVMVIVVVPSLFVPSRAHALFGVGDIVLDPANLVQNTIGAVHDSKDILITFVLKPLALALGRAAIQSITTSTVNWINGGFDGSPAFATDLRSNLRRLSDGIARDFLTELADTAKINSPFVDSLVTNVGAAYYLYADRNALANQLQDTLGQSSRDAAAFRAGNFNEGGWGAFISQVTNDANNPIGARMLASQALAGRLSAAANQRTQELAWGSGFLSWKGDCIAQVNASGTGTTTTATSLSDAEGCLDRETITPGSFIENKLNIASDSPLRQLELAQSVDAVVGALAQQLISKALGGSGGLRGASSPNPGGGSSATTNTGTDDGTGLITAKDGFETVIQTSITQVTAWKADSQTILTVAESARTACVNNPTQLASPINPAITSSTAAISKATELLVSLANLLEALQNASTSNDDLASSTYLQVVSAYQALDIPSAIDMSRVADDAKDSGTSPVPTLYKSLSTLATNNCVPFDPEKP